MTPADAKDIGDDGHLHVLARACEETGASFYLSMSLETSPCHAEGSSLLIVDADSFTSLSYSQ